MFHEKKRLKCEILHPSIQYLNPIPQKDLAASSSLREISSPPLSRLAARSRAPDLNSLDTCYFFVSYLRPVTFLDIVIFTNLSDC